MRSMQQLVAEGCFDHLGISECSAQTLRRACAACPVAMVEVEVSPWSIEQETKKGTPADLSCMQGVFSSATPPGARSR